MASTALFEALQYVPIIHTGTRDEIVAGLVREAESINRDGLMRLHAKGRELQRIAEELQTHGADLLLDRQESKSYLVFVDRHREDCEMMRSTKNLGSVCRCPELRRVPSCL